MRKAYMNKTWTVHRLWSKGPQRAIVIDASDEPIADSPECFSVRPRNKLNRFRNSISSARLSTTGWYKRYKKLFVL